MHSDNKNSKLRTQPVRKLLLFMGLPMIVSMMLQALYNIVDSAFVSNMPEGGEAAFNALTLAFPVQMLMVAIAIGTGVGANALLSRFLGQGDRDRANRTAGNAFFLGAIIYGVFLIFGIFGVSPYVRSQTSDPVSTEMAIEYLRICCIFSFGIVFYSICEKLLQATGKSVHSTIGQIAGAVANIALDPVFIYDWGLGLGVAGAAWATVVGQILSFLLDLLFHLKCNGEISKGLRYLRPDGKIVRLIYSVGLPAIISQALMSVMTYGMNLILGNLDAAVYPESSSSPYVNAYGLFYKIQQFVLFAAFGMRDAITPVVSYGYGMGDKKRVRDGICWGMIYTAVIMVLGTVVLETCAHPLLRAFGNFSGETQTLFVSAIRVISPSFLLAGACIAMQGIFQATEGGIQSLVVSLLRQAVVVLPVAWLFSLAVAAGGAAELVWLTFLIAEALTAAVGGILLAALYRKKIARLKEKDAPSDMAEETAAFSAGEE